MENKYEKIFKVSLVVRPKDTNCFKDNLILERHLLEAAKRGNMTPKSMLTDFLHGEAHTGYSLILVVQESHIAMYTYPEHGVITIDAETCSGMGSAEGILNYFKEKFEIVKEKEIEGIYIGEKYGN